MHRKIVEALFDMLRAYRFEYKARKWGKLSKAEYSSLRYYISEEVTCILLIVIL